MAITATETVEGHQRAAGPYCTPAPGANRALACATPTPGRPISAGLDHIPPPFPGRRPQFSAAASRPIPVQDDPPIAASFRQTRLRRPIVRPSLIALPPSIGHPAPGSRTGQPAACPRRWPLALDPARRLR